jgi:hypothetical protein
VRMSLSRHLPTGMGWQSLWMISIRSAEERSEFRRTPSRNQGLCGRTGAQTTAGGTRRPGSPGASPHRGTENSSPLPPPRPQKRTRRGVLHRDFADCSALAETLSGQYAAVFCLGTYTGAVSDAELRTVTVDYTIEFARVLRSSSPDAAFSFLSGNGADPTGRSRIPFARYKGEAEKALLASGFSHVFIFRPAYIYPVEPRKEPNFSYRLLRAVYPALTVLFPNQVIRADDLARAMVDVHLRGTRERGGFVFENRDIRAIVESLHTPTE